MTDFQELERTLIELCGKSSRPLDPHAYTARVKVCARICSESMDKAVSKISGLIKREEKANGNKISLMPVLHIVDSCLRSPQAKTKISVQKHCQHHVSDWTTKALATTQKPKKVLMIVTGWKQKQAFPSIVNELVKKCEDAINGQPMQKSILKNVPQKRAASPIPERRAPSERRVASKGVQLQIPKDAKRRKIEESSPKKDHRDSKKNSNAIVTPSSRKEKRDDKRPAEENRKQKEDTSREHKKEVKKDEKKEVKDEKKEVKEVKKDDKPEKKEEKNERNDKDPSRGRNRDRERDRDRRDRDRERDRRADDRRRHRSRTRDFSNRSRNRSRDHKDKEDPKKTIIPPPPPIPAPPKEESRKVEKLNPPQQFRVTIRPGIRERLAPDIKAANAGPTLCTDTVFTAVAKLAGEDGFTYYQLPSGGWIFDLHPVTKEKLIIPLAPPPPAGATWLGPPPADPPSTPSNAVPPPPPQAPPSPANAAHESKDAAHAKISPPQGMPPLVIPSTLQLTQIQQLQQQQQYHQHLVRQQLAHQEYARQQAAQQEYCQQQAAQRAQQYQASYPPAQSFLPGVAYGASQAKASAFDSRRSGGKAQAPGPPTSAAPKAGGSLPMLPGDLSPCMTHAKNASWPGQPPAPRGSWSDQTLAQSTQGARPLLSVKSAPKTSPPAPVAPLAPMPAMPPQTSAVTSPTQTPVLSTVAQGQVQSPSSTSHRLQKWQDFSQKTDKWSVPEPELEEPNPSEEPLEHPNEPTGQKPHLSEESSSQLSEPRQNSPKSLGNSTPPARVSEETFGLESAQEPASNGDDAASIASLGKDAESPKAPEPWEDEPKSEPLAELEPESGSGVMVSPERAPKIDEKKTPMDAILSEDQETDELQGQKDKFAEDLLNMEKEFQTMQK